MQEGTRGASASVWTAVGRRGFASLRAQTAESPAALAKVNDLPSYVLNCPETQVTTLPNGLRVASEVNKRSEHVSEAFLCLTANNE